MAPKGCEKQLKLFSSTGISGGDNHVYGSMHWTHKYTWISYKGFGGVVVDTTSVYLYAG